MKRITRFIAVGVPLLLALASGVFAQTQITTGVIQGTVLDEQASVVPGAKVEVKNPDINFSKTLTTDANGRFVFLQLSSGRYTLSVSKQGFATVVQENLDLTVGQAISLSLSMKVSKLEERITITAAPTIDTVKTESSSTLNEQSVGKLPILGRKFEDLLTLTPGVSITQGPDGDEINFAGQRGVFNNISLDGGDYNNGFFGEQAGGQRAAIDITLDAIKEFQVIATGASAERPWEGLAVAVALRESLIAVWHQTRLYGAAANGNIDVSTNAAAVQRPQDDGTESSPGSADQ
jgi:hypothetical protein